MGRFNVKGSDLPVRCSGGDKRAAPQPPAIQAATWFELVGDSELIAFRRPLLTTFSQPVAIGEIVGGPLNGTPVLVQIRPVGVPPLDRAPRRSARAQRSE